MSPIYIFQFSFVNQIIGVGLGFLLSSLAIYYLSLFLDNQYSKTKDTFIIVILLSLSIGIYQSFIIFFMEGVILLLILQNIHSTQNKFKDIFKKILKILCIIVTSLIIYTIVCNITYIFIGKSDYLTNEYQGWATHGFNITIHRIYRYFNDILNSQFCYTYIITIVIFASVCRRLSIIINLLMLSCLMLPFILVFTLGSPMPFRVLFSIPLCYAISNLVLYKACKHKKLFALIIFLIIFINFKQICELTYSQTMVQKYNERTFEDIYRTLQSKYNQRLDDMTIVFIATDKSDSNPHMKNITTEPFLLTNKLNLFSGVFPDTIWQTSNLNHRAYFFMKWQGLLYKMPTKTNFIWNYNR